MKILIVYFSQTGNTEKIGRAIFDEVSAAHAAELKKIDEITPASASSYDLVFVGSPCHAGDLSAPAKAFLEGLPKGSKGKVAGFITHASAAYEREGFMRCIGSYEAAVDEKGIGFLGCFDCVGYLSPDIQPYVKKARKVSDDEWERIVERMTGHPDAGDEQEARAFARRVIESL